MTAKPITPDDYHYGAVEALAKQAYLRAGVTALPDPKRKKWEDLFPHQKSRWMTGAVGPIRALEAAGYKVVGPEPTDEMVARVNSVAFLSPGMADELLREAIAAAPTLTEQKP